MVLNTEWAQVEVIDLINDGSGLAFGIIGGRSTGVVVKTIVPGGVADRDGRLQSGDHILQIGEVNLRGLGSEQVASVLRQCGVHVRMIVARPIESTSLDIQSLVSHAPVVPTKILGDPVELDRHLIENGFGDLFSALPPSNDFTTPYIYTGQQTDIQLHSLPRLNEFKSSTNGTVLSVSPNLSLSSSKISSSLDADLQKQTSPETEMYTVKLCKDDLGLGITVAGYVCEKEEISGIFVKSISQGSAADINGRIKVNDRIVEVDGLSVVGQTNHQAVEMLRNTGPVVTITLERYLRGPKYEQLQQAIRANELKPPSPPSPSISSLPKVPLSLANSSIEADGESRTSFDFDSAVLLEITPTNEQQEIVIDGRKSVQFSICSHESIHEKWKGKLEVDAEIVIAEMTKDDNSGLGISLEGTVDVEGGQEVRPHHYIRNILPNGPVGRHGILRSGDELLEVNGIQLLGINHVEVVSILKQLPNFVVLVCARRPVPTRIINTAQCRDAFQARNILAGSLQTLIPNSDKLVKAKSDTSIASSSSDTCCSDIGSRSRSFEVVTGLPLWSSDHTVVDLVKGDYGLGFSILDYQDPLALEKTVIIIRSLVPGGVAQADGRLIPGDRLIAVNDTIVDHSTLDRAVHILKSAPKGRVKITVAKPISATDNASCHSQDTDQEDQIYFEEFQECIEEYQECLEVVQICFDDAAGSFKYSSSAVQLGEKKIGTQDDANNWLNVSFDSDVCKMDDLKTVSESDASFKSTCDRSDSAVESGKRGDGSVRLSTVREKINGTNKNEEVSEKDGYETCMDDSLSEDIKPIDSCSIGEETPTNSNLNLKLQEELRNASVNQDDVSVISTPNTVLSVNLNSSSEPFLNKNDLAKTNHICLDTKLDDSIEFYNNQTDDSLCGDEFFLVQCYKDDLSNFRPEVVKCSSEPNVLDTYEVCVPTVRYRRCIKEYYNDYEECLESYRIYTQQNAAEMKLKQCSAASGEMMDDEIFNEILLPMRSKSAPNILDNSFVTLTYDPGPDLNTRRKSAFVTGYGDDVNTESMTVTRPLDSSVAASDFSSMLQKHWGSIRTVEINREPNTSLGISIVGGKVDIHAPKTSPESILGIFIKNVVPDSPAGKSGKLNTGDRILEVSGIDLREVNHEKAVEIIRNAPNPVVFLIQSLIPWNVDDNHQTDNKSSPTISSPEKIKPPERFCSEPPIPSIEDPPLPEVTKPVPPPSSQQAPDNTITLEIIPKSDKNIETVLVYPTDDAIKATKIQEDEKPSQLPTVAPAKPEKIDAPKVQIELSPQVFGLAKEVKPVAKFEKSSASEKNEKSTESESEESEEEEDVRQLEGRTVSAKGHEIDRASAANVKRTKEEIAVDPDEEDDFGYTMRK
ncbi:hypothetical protein Trydic_g4558 [Trypoxylus dichotomus]